MACAPNSSLLRGTGACRPPADPSATTPDEWAEFLYLRNNTKGIHAERWRHVRGCARFFNALRDTTTDHFLATYRAGEPMPAIQAGPKP